MEGPLPVPPAPRPRPLPAIPTCPFLSSSGARVHSPCGRWCPGLRDQRGGSGGGGGGLPHRHHPLPGGGLCCGPCVLCGMPPPFLAPPTRYVHMLPAPPFKVHPQAGTPKTSRVALF